MTTMSGGEHLAVLSVVVFAACGGEVLRPQVQDFSPKEGTVGTEISIQGQHFDRDGGGYLPAAGTQTWHVYLLTPDRRYELAVSDATDHSLVVKVPEGAASGHLAIADADGVISESSARFEVYEHPKIRVTNDGQYDVVDLRFSGEQVLVDGLVLESGASIQVPVTSGRYRLEYGIGEPKAVWLRGALRGVEAGGLGTEVVATIPALEPLDLLAPGRVPTDWVAQLKDVHDEAASVTLRVYGDGTWALFEGTTPTQQGSLTLDTITPYARNVGFRLSETGATAKMSPPFTSFDLENGPAHWRLLHYVKAGGG